MGKRGSVGGGNTVRNVTMHLENKERGTLLTRNYEHGCWRDHEQEIHFFKLQFFINYIRNQGESELL